MKTNRKMLRKPVRLDRAIVAPVFDREVIDRAFRESLLVARLFRRPAKYLRGRSGAAR